MPFNVLHLRSIIQHAYFYHGKKLNIYSLNLCALKHNQFV